MISTVRVIHRNVEHCPSGETCGGPRVACSKPKPASAKVAGYYRGLANLAIAIERDLLRCRQSVTPTPTEELTTAVTV
jgi:hypothetical protein